MTGRGWGMEAAPGREEATWYSSWKAISAQARCSPGRACICSTFTPRRVRRRLRIVLNLKGVGWQAHPVDISSDENLGEWFLGINPRGLVPVLVIDGAVHIESNDIVSLLDSAVSRAPPDPRGQRSGNGRAAAPRGRAAPRFADDLVPLYPAEGARAQIEGSARRVPRRRQRHRAGRCGSQQGRRDRLLGTHRARRDHRRGIRVSAARFRQSFEDFDRRLDSASYFNDAMRASCRPDIAYGLPGRLQFANSSSARW